MTIEVNAYLYVSCITFIDECLLYYNVVMLTLDLDIIIVNIIVIITILSFNRRN